ncbi:MAG: sigma-54-dependent Fis family transcriptional regulator [Deltaproteobacteria bacterium]|nr:MAG: sigma-54-dependent Fis family transcriptional regulator [Deltaproteobacteria bacterium]
MEEAEILVVDDESNMRKVLSAILRREGYRVTSAATGAEALAWLATHRAAAVLTDLRMPGMDGLTLLKEINATDPQLPVIILTAYGTVNSAVEALKEGAFDYIQKPFEQEEIRQVIAKAVRTERLSRKDLPVAPETRGAFEIVGESPAMQEIYRIIRKVAPSSTTVLITGESGTGKELVANALHRESPRRNAPFIKTNCAAIPPTLLESEFFGHEKGAFTGAVAGKPGRFELADGGTLFLDEIGELPREMQAKLLRVLQDRSFERVGGVKTIEVDVRVIAATNTDLVRAVAEGKFREDLFYRLNVVTIALPPLRSRREDIALLANHFLEEMRRRHGRPVRTIDPAALARLTAYDWPGNIRQLQNVIERALLFAEGETIRPEDLPPEISPVAPEKPTLSEGTSLKEKIRQTTWAVERDLIEEALYATRGNITRAAARLKISRKSLQLKMKEFGLRDRDFSEKPTE